MVSVPCGKCIECRLRRKRDLAVRSVHEASLWERSCFITLTIDDKHMEPDRSVRKRTLQNFFKRLRKNQPTLRYLACGEYGDDPEKRRPHYHACVFGEDFSADRFEWEPTRKGFKQWRSPRLEKAWPYGFSTIGTLTADSASYTAAYTVKKMTGEAAVREYLRYGENGSMWHVEPPFALMSRNPGLGHDWIERYAHDVYGSKEYPRSSCLLKGKEVPPPVYYDRWLESKDPEWFAAVQDLRRLQAKSVVKCTPQQEYAREINAEARSAFGSRPL